MPQTGPRTPEGKAIVSRNAVRNGLYAAPSIAVGDEAPGDWDHFHRDIVEDRSPDGPLEASLASRVAILLWRLRRLHRAEAAAITDRLAHNDAVAAARAARYGDEPDDEDEDEDDADQEDGSGSLVPPALSFYATAFVGRRTPPPPPLLPDERTLATLVRFEAHLNRQLMQTLHELEALQSRRRGSPSPLARVDVHGLPGL
jgi:hypothetical protein